MKIQLIFLSAMLLGMVFVGDSYGQVFVPYPTSDPSLPEISMQVIARNSNGQLIAYFEPTLWYIADLQGLHSLLNTKEKTTIEKNGQQLEEFQFRQVYYFHQNNSGQITSEPLYFEGHEVLSPRHDGIMMKPGDTINVYWKILRFA